ncbi:hypothetical protein BB559_001049 [Furculomyces boomerangus]|uniref:GCS light chain n=2 Tax=Harpellales TaxID=61421 RepID=A0A2T9Z3C1_9FUNG|nr:hypothetical protein BB559_001049 [Furculomyces boomerangus]PVZ98293.1 hypothetical protein BB558_005692 [Smittium angustum]PWA02445.1 hypothetical protein BB558_001423 [Smittium angustum]
MAQVQISHEHISQVRTKTAPTRNFEIMIYTDNLMHTGISSIDSGVHPRSKPELEVALRETFQFGIDTSSVKLDRKDNILMIKDCRDSRNLGILDSSEDIEVTAKIFFLDFVNCSNLHDFQDMVDTTLKSLKSHLNVKTIHSLILSFNGGRIQHDSPDSSSENISATKQDILNIPETSAFVKLWLALIDRQNAGDFKLLGVSDFTLENLTKFKELGIPLPNINQINVPSNGDLSESLLEFSSDHNVELLSHKDQCCSITHKYLSQLTDSTYFDPYIPDYVTENGQNLNIRPRVVVKYSTIIKNRSIVRSKGYIVTLSQQS